MNAAKVFAKPCTGKSSGILVLTVVLALALVGCGRGQASFALNPSPSPSPAPVPAEEQPATPEPTPLPSQEPDLPSGTLPDLSPPAEGWIAFRTPEGFLTLVSPDGSRSVSLTNLGEVMDAFWSPDGRQLAVTRRSGDMIGAQLALVSLEDSRYTTLTPPGRVNARDVVWSQDGRYLAYLWVMAPGAPRSPLALHVRDLATGEVVTVTTYSNDLIPDPEIPALSTHPMLTFPYPLLPVCMVAVGVGCNPFEILDVRTGQAVADLGPVGYAGSAWLPQGKGLVIPKVEWEKEGVRVEGEEVDPLSLAVWQVGDEAPRVILEGAKKRSYHPLQLLPDGRLVVQVSEWEKEEYGGDKGAWPERVEYWLFQVDEAGELHRIEDGLPWWVTSGFPAGFAQGDRVDNWLVGPDGVTVVFELKQMETEGERLRTAIYVWRGEGEPIHLGVSDEMIFPQWQPR